MKILFLIGATSRIRNFDHAIQWLAQRGHTIRLTGRPRKGVFVLPKSVQHERISGGENPTQRSDGWRDYVDSLRGARDYVRYFDPRYASATRLTRRAYESAPTAFVLFCERHPWIKRHWRLAAAALAFAERLVPVDPGFEAFLRGEAPDVIAVTPLVTFESYQTDYVKAAHRLGIPIVFLPFSWDNLTNKGLVRIQPDRSLVWNDTQKREAIALHDVPADSVIITGAARFDDFFARTARTGREELFTQHALDPGRPMVLYIGSSQLTGPNEMELVRRWAESLRAAEDETLRRCAILVRPHPAVKESWVGVDLSELGNIGVSLDASRNADQDLFDSLFHAHAVVGLNTSAMLEAAIVGRPVFTLTIPPFDEGQVGTIHFRYLVEAHGGLATVARSFEEHHRQLLPALQRLHGASSRNVTFVEGFLRPRGLEQPVSPILAAEIEQAAALAKRPVGSPLWHRPVRAALHWWLRRRAATPALVDDRSIIASSLSLRPVKTALQELADGSAPIFVGPWIDSVANELIYWIPFVRWACAAYGLSPERLIAVSRGGVRQWYAPVARRYVDTASLFSPSEQEQWQRRTIPQSEQNPKQAVMYPFDLEVVERAARALELSDFQVLHPLSFFRVLRRLESDRAVGDLPQVLRYQRLTGGAGRTAASTFAPPYVAVSLAFTAALPTGPSNRQFLSGLLARVGANDRVVLVDYPSTSGVPVDAHSPLPSVAAIAEQQNYLEVQTEVIARARAFVGGFGDLAMVAHACGVPAYTFYSEEVPPEVLALTRVAAETAGWTAEPPVPVDHLARLRLPAQVPA